MNHEERYKKISLESFNGRDRLILMIGDYYLEKEHIYYWICNICKDGLKSYDSEINVLNALHHMTSETHKLALELGKHRCVSPDETSCYLN